MLQIASAATSIYVVDDAGITSKAVLMEALFEALKFPDYFGSNWDALWECICDFSWLPDGDVVLSHQGLPLSEDRAFKDAVEKWSATGKRKLLVMFPPDTESIVTSVLTEAESRN
jgi:RNAse (barnase) inhibitor barstar